MRRNYLLATVFTVLLSILPLMLFAQMTGNQTTNRQTTSRQAAGNQTINNQRLPDIEGIISLESNENTFRDDKDDPETEEIEEMPDLDSEDMVYGQNFFTSGNNFAPNMNMPTPANYVLGTGDELIIDVWGNSELSIRRAINPDGHITLPGLGRIQLAGLSVAQAKLRIRSNLATIYSDLNSYEPQTFFAMSVGNIRTIRVNVMGEVSTPGTYTMSSFATAFHALYVAGGPNNIGSLRNIRIFRNGEVAATIDLYDYLMNGNNTGDISLQEGDIVRVEPHGILAQIVGDVRRPMWYEMRENETLADLIRFSGGFTSTAFQANITLGRKGAEDMQIYTLEKREYASFHLRDGDQVTVESISDRITNMVSIFGAVYRPGRYAIGEEIRTMRDLVNIAHGAMGDAYLHRVVLIRQQEDLRDAMQSFNLSDLMSGRIPDITLQNNDRLYVPSIFSMEEDVTISISGAVRNPGTFSFALNQHVEDLILRAGGLLESASTAQIDVFRRRRDPASVSSSAAISESFSFSLQEGEMTLSDRTFVLEPFDEIVVRYSPGYEVQQHVTVRGEVLFGGTYARIRRDERLSSFIERAGGLTDFAYARGASLTRPLTEGEQKRTRAALTAAARVEGDMEYIDELDFSRHSVGINLERALRYPGSDADLILQEGDELFIPVRVNTVKISGGVLFPNTIVYDERMSLNSYVRQAGGFTRLALRNRAFVVHMNGTISTGRWATIHPGDEIIVPERPVREPMTLQNWVGMSSSLATVALLILNIVR